MDAPAFPRPTAIERLIRPEAQQIIDNFVGMNALHEVDTLLVVLRGMPGSGKTTFASTMEIYARSLGLSVRVCSADHYFDGEDGYVFAHHLLPEAHKQCWRRFVSAVRSGVQVVILDNTNVAQAEWTEYENFVTWENYDRLWDVSYDSIQVVKVQFACSNIDMAYQLNHRGKRIDSEVIRNRFRVFEQHSTLFSFDYLIMPSLSVAL
ncbi:hypothetical protein PINS_up019352 [Pythium insidiosum]|nr:hypothetical protein PINS_up019352 [Pythium insidiosum]